MHRTEIEIMPKGTEMKSTESALLESFTKSDNPWDIKSANLLRDAQVRHGGKIRILSKRENLGWLCLWTALKWLVFAVTFGKGFDMVDGPYTTFGRYIFCPGDGKGFIDMKSAYRYGLLFHEITHIDHMFLRDPDAQGKVFSEKSLTFKFFSYIYVVYYAFAYVMLLSPYVYASFRTEAEYHGYKRNMLVYAQKLISYKAELVFFEENYIEEVDPSFTKRQILLMEIDRLSSCFDELNEFKNHIKWYKKQFTSWNYGKMTTEENYEKLIARMLAETKAEIKKEESIDFMLELAKWFAPGEYDESDA